MSHHCGSADVRLEAAYRRITAGEVDLLSLDVFDTLLYRKVPRPADVFLITGRELKANGRLIPAVSAESFVALRSGAERMARIDKGRRRGTRSEVTLAEIYWQLRRALQRSPTMAAADAHGVSDARDIEGAMAAEVAVEVRLVRLDQDVAALAAYAKATGLTVVLVSDTYFTLKELRSLLDRRVEASGDSVLRCVDAIYASSEYAYGKAHGLFERMLRDQRVAARRTLHIGDQKDSDYLPATKLGMQAILRERYDDAFREVMDREWPGQDLASRSLMLDGDEGDFGLSATRAELRHSSRTVSLKAKDAFFWRSGASVLGPVLAGVGLWIHERCQEMGQGQVVCLLREGRLYADVIRWLSPYLKTSHVEPLPLWVSRRFIMGACISSGTAAEIEMLLGNAAALPAPFTVAAFCEYLGLNETARRFRRYAGVVLLDRTFCRDLCEYLSSDQGYRAQIVANAAAKRRRYLTYLTRVVDLDRINQITVVDVGWRGTVQRALEVILQLCGYRITLHGLYLAVFPGAALAPLGGRILEGYIVQAGQPLGGLQVLRRGLYVLEQAAIGDCRTMVDVTEDGEVVTDRPFVSENQQREAMLAQEGIKAFCDALGKKIAAGDIRWSASSAALKTCLLNMATGLAGSPTREEAIRYSSWRHDVVTASDAPTFSLGRSGYYRRFIADMLPHAAYLGIEETWHASYAARVDPFLALMCRVESQMTVPARCFLSRDYLVMSVFWDRGAGFGRRPRKRILLRSNPNRSFFAYCRVCSPKTSIRRIRLVLPFSGLIQVRSLRFDIGHQASAVTEHRCFFETPAVGNDGLHTSPREVVRGVFASRGKQPLDLVYDVDVPDAFLVQVRLCCATFSVPVGVGRSRRG